MRAADAEAIVVAAHVEPVYYSFESAKHEALCLMAQGQTWHVFLSERGQRYEEREFGDEDQACVYFLTRLFELTSKG